MSDEHFEGGKAKKEEDKKTVELHVGDKVSYFEAGPFPPGPQTSI